ncbi:MAG: hypothetical protein CMF96_06325 [Candidatus Marinimicrobia bacterium]|nr:hypothetical protein [Candidatus Neomarinimicrobiota bacterium]|tara:strand:- start:52 stop:1101 length:1050 start_codon:yes stop_codon:yes gene_type:complete
MRVDISKQENLLKISIIIPHFNGENIILNCLESLQKTTYKNKEIIVVDNGSTDKSIFKIERQFPEVKIIKSKNNRGYAGGCNLGSENAEGELLIFLNNDTIHNVNWIEPLLIKIESDPKISSVQPKILNAIKKNNFDYAGGSGGYLDKYGFPFARGRIFDFVEEDLGQYDDPSEIFWASGTAFITKKKIFHKVGGFDETLFAHFEEIDYHWKCKLAGYKVWVNPKSVIYHIGGATLSYQSPTKKYLNHRNSLILMLTNTSKFQLIKYTLPRLFFEKVSFIKEFFSGNFSNSFAQIRAVFWILFNLSFIFRKRKSIKNLYPIYDTNYFYKNSIVWDYFFKNKHKFTDLKK